MPATPVLIAAHRARTKRLTLAHAALPSLALIVVAAGVGWAQAKPAGSRAHSTSTAPSTGAFIVDGVRLPYLRGGRGDVVLVLPDSAESVESWRPQVMALDDRHLAVVYQRRNETTAAPSPGGGNADSPDVVLHSVAGSDAPSSSPDARRLRELLRLAAALTPDPVHLIGEGEGARLAIRLALEHPERVRSLVVSAPDPRWFTSDADVAAARAGVSIRASADTMLACRRLWRIELPVLVITGEHDWRNSGDTAPLRCVRSSREQLLRGAAMQPHLEASQDFNRAVVRFLERRRMTAGEP